MRPAVPRRARETAKLPLAPRRSSGDNCRLMLQVAIWTSGMNTKLGPFESPPTWVGTSANGAAGLCSIGEEASTGTNHQPANNRRNRRDDESPGVPAEPVAKRGKRHSDTNANAEHHQVHPDGPDGNARLPIENRGHTPVWKKSVADPHPCGAERGQDECA